MLRLYFPNNHGHTTRKVQLSCMEKRKVEDDSDMHGKHPDYGEAAVRIVNDKDSNPEVNLHHQGRQMTTRERREGSGCLEECSMTVKQ